MLTGLDHVCVVSADLDRAIRIWADRYGVGPWSVWTKDASNMAAAVDGRATEFAMRVALASLPSGVRIELIQPLDDRSPYAESLARHGGADHIHHLRFDIDDHDASAARLRDGLGLRTILHARFAGAPGVEGSFTGTYFDTESDLGFVMEIGVAPEGFAMPAPDDVYPR
jgi:catechol 2,3-dioxygenase-like lactoylglutathione lyase family enzyme